MLIYFFIPIILFILIKINIMAILICISLYVKCFVLNKIVLNVDVVAFSDGAAEVFLRMPMKPLIRDY